LSFTFGAKPKGFLVKLESIKLQHEDELWTPSPERVKDALMTEFLTSVGLAGAEYSEVHRWSIEKPAEFWSAVWDFCEVVGDKGNVVLRDGDRMPGAQWFPEARLNFAENLLRRRDDSEAIVFWNENGKQVSLTREELFQATARCATALRAAGIVEGDRVAAYLPNIPETVIIMLAAASLGAVFSSCSPDFGAQGVVDRFGQIEPKILFVTDGYWYNSKPVSILEKCAEVASRLTSVEKVVVVPFLDAAPETEKILHAQAWREFLGPSQSAETLEFTRLPFNHPLFILYSSGTTGAPKCILHGAGGTLLQLLKEHQLHCDIKPGDRLFFFTTCGWMMWNWLVTGLASAATVMLYDGSPLAGGGGLLFDYAQQERTTHFGTSAKFIDAIAKKGLSPAHTHDLSTLGTIFSTGSPLSPESFDYVYRHIKSDVLLASICGGTDIISAFVLGNPLLSVRRGQIQCRGLGMAVDVFDEQGRPVAGEKGDLVCTKPFPSMPLGFWDDAEGTKYSGAYFDKFSGVWAHGDYAEITASDGIIIYGRSDATLNPGGVRIGTAEIYRQVEQLPEVLESLVIGQEWSNDTRIVLFVKLRGDIVLNDEWKSRIKATIRENATPRHVPALIIAVEDIPRTKSGKIVELAVRETVHGRPVKNLEALANPESLKYFANLEELRFSLQDLHDSQD
jgi:acetoacetyl-CoA synthetase